MEQDTLVLMEQLVAKRLLIDALKKADEENQGSNLVSKREFLKKKLFLFGTQILREKAVFFICLACRPLVSQKKNLRF